MLKKFMLFALALIYTPFYASEGKSGFFGQPGAPSRPPLPPLGSQVGTPVPLPRNELTLFIEQLSSEPTLRNLSQRYPNITRIVLDRMEDTTQLSLQQINLLQYHFPRLTHLELSSNLLNSANRAHIQKFFPELNLVIQQIPVPEIAVETTQKTQRPKREREEETTSPQEETKEQEEEIKQEPKKRRSSTSSSSSTAMPPKPPKSKSDTALLQKFSGKFGQTVKGALEKPRKILRAIRKGSKTSSSSTSSSSSAPFDLVATIRQDINQLNEQVLQERNRGLGFEDVPGEARNYTRDALDELAEALQAAKTVLDHAQAGVTSTGEFSTIIANFERAFKALKRLDTEFRLQLDPNYIPMLTDRILKAVRAFNDLAAFVGDYEASERLTDLSKQLTQYR